ncbi:MULTISPECIES: phospholipid carrier-dependent glycosyltransferase [Arthrobacter]|uniref:Polyprenol-phosphate-mannose--protein mannosyltransferase n=2 Tax=Arthrobacter TaxID=1663 RepID=A0ABU9KN94_9MICC|nr:phospholipid carrier-dependent glycosyltransferase [Arthrobacter sp. YJM1]MDP5227353.1 glycosyltransferase family 39 protein [Arthrobacter sp. YJM1]
MRSRRRRRPSAPGTSGWILDPREAFTEASLRERLLGPVQSWRDYSPSLRLWFWLGPVLTAVLGGVLRFVRLGDPHSLVFDETYYVKDAYSLLQSGFERNWAGEANAAFNRGDPSLIQSSAEYVVHPPLGKWMIAWGMDLFGQGNTFGSRFSSAVVGTLSILILALVAQKLFSSVTLGTVAGLLIAVDGTHLVMSRIGILDIFLEFWVLVVFAFLLLDRQDGRRRLAARLARLAAASPTGVPDDAVLRWGPGLGFRWWRLAASAAMGAAVGIKWSGLFFLAVFGLLMVLWDMNARRVAGVKHWAVGATVRDGIPAFFLYLGTATAVYLSTWTGWFLSSDAYNRRWAEQNPGQGVLWLPAPLRSLWQYHEQAYAFHQSLSADHPYKASSWTWLVLGRPTSFYYQSPQCGAAKCSEAILSVGNPLIWWGGTIALVVLLFVWAGRRDWRAGAILAGMAGGYLPWFMYPDRTTFFFYAVAFEPFLILALCYGLGLFLGKRQDPPWRRRAGFLVVAVFLAAVLALSAFFYPIWTAETISYNDWHLRMWMPSWI